MSKTLVDRIFLLESVQLFEGLAVDDLAAVAGIAEERAVAPGEVVYREGDIGESMFVIVQGEVLLDKKGRHLLTLKTNDSFGQVSILDRGPRPVTARAGTEGAMLLVVERAPFLDLLADRIELIQGFFAVLARRLRELLELTEDPASNVAPAKGEKSTVNVRPPPDPRAPSRL